MSTLLAKRYQNRINLLRSVARWLGSRTGTVWAKQYKLEPLMSEYASSLQELASLITQPDDLSRLVEVIEGHPALTIEGELASLIASIKLSLRPISMDDIFEGVPAPSELPGLPFLIYSCPEAGSVWECKTTGQTRPATPSETQLWAMLAHKES